MTKKRHCKKNNCVADLKRAVKSSTDRYRLRDNLHIISIPMKTLQWHQHGIAQQIKSGLWTELYRGCPFMEPQHKPKAHHIPFIIHMNLYDPAVSQWPSTCNYIVISFNSSLQVCSKQIIMALNIEMEKWFRAMVLLRETQMCISLYYVYSQSNFKSKKSLPHWSFRIPRGLFNSIINLLLHSILAVISLEPNRHSCSVAEILHFIFLLRHI